LSQEKKKAAAEAVWLKAHSHWFLNYHLDAPEGGSSAKTRCMIHLVRLVDLP
jgi:hypothetical protein